MTEKPAIIFDLGKVLINLDFSKTEKYLSNFCNRNISLPEFINKNQVLFNAFEKGLETTSSFRKKLNTLLSLKLSDVDFDTAWNALLLDIPVERIQLLKKLKNSYRLFLLSNTNELHHQSFTKSIEKQHGKAIFSQLFEKEYYSHLVNKRKPESEIYLQALQENNLIPNTTLFIDDSLENIHGANTLGIKTYHLKENDNILNIKYTEIL